MSWIKDNKFLAGLGAGTLVSTIGLVAYGLSGAGKWDASKEAFDQTLQKVNQFEKLPLYPSKANLDGKSVALSDYRNAAESLQVAFDPYRPKEIINVSPQEFSNQLKKANDETRAAFGEKTTVPAEYFLGFEAYKKELVSGNATGVLLYQLSAVKKLMLSLATSGASRLVNIHRPELEEEKGQVFVPAKDQVARALPLEVTFVGTEQSVRDFLSALANSEDRYFVIRTMSVRNEKQAPPKVKDAQFDPPTVAAPQSSPESFFGTPADSAAALFGEANTQSSTGEEAPPEPAPVQIDTSRILSQVLGSEKTQVFLRLDILQFLPAKELP